MQPEQQWLITMIAIASVTLLSLVVLFVVLCRQWRNDKEEHPIIILDEKSETTTASLPIVIALAGGTEVSNMTNTDDDDSYITTTTTTTTYDWPPVVVKTSLRCPKLDYATSNFEEASIDTPLQRYLQLNVSGQLKSSSMDESSIVRNMKAALAGLRGEPSCEASEL